MKPICFTVQLGDRKVLVTNQKRMPRASAGCETLGYCWQDQLLVKRTLKGKDACEVLIHEALHHLFPILKEEVIDTAAAQLAELLSRPECEELIWEHS